MRRNCLCPFCLEDLSGIIRDVLRVGHFFHKRDYIVSFVLEDGGHIA